MAKFCDACGTPCADDATFCAGCGKQLTAQPAPQQPVYQAPQQPVYQAPQQPQYQAPQYQQPQYQAPQQPQYGYQPAPAAKPADFVGYIRQYLMIIIAVVAAFALLAGILNLFGLYDVDATMTAMGQTQKNSGPLSDIRNSGMDQVTLYVISTYVMGIVGLAAAGLLGYAAYLLYSKKPGSKNMFFYGSIALAAGSLVALLMGLFGGTVSETSYGMTVKMTLGVNWTYWVCVILGAGLVVIDKVLFKEDSRPLQ